MPSRAQSTHAAVRGRGTKPGNDGQMLRKRTLKKKMLKWKAKAKLSQFLLKQVKKGVGVLVLARAAAKAN
jgi:hypothetical protein